MEFVCFFVCFFLGYAVATWWTFKTYLAHGLLAVTIEPLELVCEHWYDGMP
jgi:hypothetical protein